MTAVVDTRPRPGLGAAGVRRSFVASDLLVQNFSHALRSHFPMPAPARAGGAGRAAAVAYSTLVAFFSTLEG